MYNSYYNNREVGQFQSVGGQNDQEDEVDYSFSRLSVKERRKLFMDEQEPRQVFQFSTLPRSFGNRNRFESQSDMGDWNPPIQKVSANYSQSFQRPNAVYANSPAVSGRTIQLSPQRIQPAYAPPPPQKTYYAQNAPPASSINEQLVQPSYMAPRQSRQPNRPSPSMTTIRVGSDYPQTPTPVTRVFNRSYTVPRTRDTTSMTHELTPTNVQVQQAARPLRVRVYNSDRSVPSPGYAQSVSNWGPTSPVYPAYPAYGPRPVNNNSQIYRVVQSPQRAYPRTLERSYNYAPLAAPVTPIYVPLSPNERRLDSAQRFPQKSITIYPSVAPRQNQARPTNFQPTAPLPIKVAPPGSMTPMPMRTRSAVYQPWSRGPRGPAKQPVVVNRKTLQPSDEDIGVSEF